MGSFLGAAILSFTLVLGLGVFGAIIFAAFKQRGWRRALGMMGGLLVVFGLLGFLASIVAPWAPSSFEWPIGWAGQVVTTPSGMHAVAHDPSNRVQVYDADWRFQRGWHVDAGGGIYARFAALPDNTLEVVTARRPARYVYDLQGIMLSQAPGLWPPHSSGNSGTIDRFVFTWPWLLPLAHPAIGFITMLSGFGTLFASGHLPIKTRQKPLR